MRNNIFYFLISKIKGFKNLNNEEISEKLINKAISVVTLLRPLDIESIFVFPMKSSIKFEIHRLSDIEEELVIDKEGNLKIIEYTNTGDLISNKSIEIEQIPSFFI